ncbi:MAG: DUF998 domain-containing protein [Euryarchaeota archaeon]|nr:DUF998 domain-containing protein [Euryarchaeota archaeon]
MDPRDILTKSAPYIGIAGAILFALMWPAAVAVTGDWVLGRDTLSELGGKPNAAAPIFSAACIIAGICALLFSSALYGIPRARAGAALFTLASMGLVMVGVFPIYAGTAHTVATIWFFGPVALSVIFLTPAFLRTKELRLSAIVGVGGLIVSFASLALSTYQLAEAVAVASVIALGVSMGAQLAIMRRKAIRRAMPGRHFSR